MPKIYYAKPSIGPLEINYATDAAAHGWGDNCYAYVQRFEADFCRYMGLPHAVATSSATGALHLGLAALGIGQGDEVILADTNWVASVAPVVHLGATPVFVDILADTWCLDPQQVERAISPRTKAILAVHLYGNLCAMDVLERIAKEHGLYLVEDAAEAIGSSWGQVKAGCRGIFGAFSFHGTKTLTTGEGGMLVTKDASLYERVLTLNNHGRRAGDSRQFWATEVGYKYKMSNIQAALGCAQLERIDVLTARRREVFFIYQDLLKKYALPAICNPIPAHETYGYWMPTLVFDQECGFTQQQAIEALRSHGIDGRGFFAPLSAQAHFADQPDNVRARSIAARAINLPSYHDLQEEEQEYVIRVLHEACRHG